METSRLWARVVAWIEPEWAEVLAAHLVKREYSEIKEFYETERNECKEIFGGYGLSPQSQETLVNELANLDEVLNK